MNKIILVGIICTAATLAACGISRSPATSTQTETASNSGVSRGIYDSSTRETALTQGDLADSASPSRKASNPRGTGSGNGSGGGGGGGQESQTIMPRDNISLSQVSSSQSGPIPINRKIVRNGELQVECAEPNEAQQRITQIAQGNGGFVVESQQSTSDIKINTRDIVQMSVRVPADKFTDTVDHIKAASGRLIQETIKGEDVTEEFIDIDARLAAKKALEQQFMEIMKRADSVDEALNVHSQLADVRTEVEKIEGRKRFLENQASLSTIKIRLQTPAVFSANSAGFYYRLSESFGNGFDIALNFMLGLVTFVVGALPLFVFVGLPGYFIVRAVLRKRSRPMTVTEIAKEELSTD